ncbi:MAG: flavohemoglobin expression-modulating QEGLA motif protein [Flavobacteriaceae bacterium]|nr:flavohemoglobin expression-modulating QEGLA motif protein [Flavobacteriaceae bacterium]MCI5087618.1 flavohemoglobin expression-modulating QEGLA motif protein [Flavobacteriaceae bacterium]
MNTHSLVLELASRYPKLYKIDLKLNALVKKIELLSYLNPVNIEGEKAAFYSSKFTKNPLFKYPKNSLDAFVLQRSFFAQEVEHIASPDLAKLYKDTISYYSNMIQCITSIGKGNEFYYNSLRVFGSPNEKDVRNATFILHLADELEDEDSLKNKSPEEARQFFIDFAAANHFPLEVKFSNQLAADAMVKNSTKTLLIKKNTHFSSLQLKTLAHHEIGLHLLTTYNAAKQPLHIFSNGFPMNVETQEGLAVMSEYLCGAMRVKRLKELAYRVLAVDSLIKGYDFKETFNLLHSQYQMPRDAAFTTTLRAHRGGGFTKDRLYLSGLKKIYDLHKGGKSLDNLLLGKTSLEYQNAIIYLKEEGLLAPAAFKNKILQSQQSQNNNLSYVLENLR